MNVLCFMSRLDPRCRHTKGQAKTLAPVKARKWAACASSPYQRGVGIRSKPVVILLLLVVPPLRTDISGASGEKGHLVPAAPLLPPPSSQPGKPRFASPNDTGRKGTQALVSLEGTDEDFELGSSSTPRAPRKSREKTRAT
jgi:hypothetical protein